MLTFELKTSDNLDSEWINKHFHFFHFLRNNLWCFVKKWKYFFFLVLASFLVKNFHRFLFFGDLRDKKACFSRRKEIKSIVMSINYTIFLIAHFNRMSGVVFLTLKLLFCCRSKVFRVPWIFSHPEKFHQFEEIEPNFIGNPQMSDKLTK